MTLTGINAQVAQQQPCHVHVAGALLILATYNLIVGALRGGATYYYHCGFILSILLIGLTLADLLPWALSQNNLLHPRRLPA